MKLEFSKPRFYGLKLHFVFRSIVSLAACTILFLVLYSISNVLVDIISEETDFNQSHMELQSRNLQEYVDAHKVSSSNLALLKKWERRHPVLFLEIVQDGYSIYRSDYGVTYVVGEESGSGNKFLLRLTDGDTYAYLYSDFTYQYYVFGTVFSAVVALLLFIALNLQGNRKLIQYVCRLNEEVQILEGGNLEYEVSVEGNDELTDLAKSMNQMRTSFLCQMEEKQRIHRENRKLVTEMSHDLRTPLTGILLYLEILRSHRYSSEEELQDYLQKIDGKAHHMKQLSDHLLECAVDRTVEKPKEPMEMKEAFSSVVEDFISDLKVGGFSVVSDIQWEKCFVAVKKESVLRIFGNLGSNIQKYVAPSSEIHLETIFTEQYCGFSLMNPVQLGLLSSDSHGIGLESIHSLMRVMGGKCTVEETDSFFEVSLYFPKQ